MITQSTKNLCRSVFLALLIPLLGWATWVTAQTYNSQQTKQALVEYKTHMSSQQQEIKQEVRDLRKEVRENHQIVYNILLDLQKHVQ